MPVSFVICAAGLGRRMEPISKSIPKPLIKIDGKTLLERSIESLPIREGDQILVAHPTNQEFKSVLQSLQNRWSFAEVISLPIDRITRGQLETAFLTLSHIPSNNTLCIYNADTYFQSSFLRTSLEDMTWEGIIPCSREPGEAWSFCEVEKQENETLQNVIRVTEKERISEHCSVGFYSFRNKEVFAQLAQQEILDTPNNKEVYIAPLYNRYIKNGFKIAMLEVDIFQPMGTLDQIESYWKIPWEKVREENK